MAVRLANNLYGLIGNVPYGKRFLERGGASLVGQAIPGSLITTGLTTLATGNIGAGLAVGGTDLITSSLLARGLGSKGLSEFLAKHNLPQVKGKFRPDVDLDKARTMKAVYKSPKYYAPSGAQNLGMLVGSVGSTLAVEPLFYPQNSVQQQQLAQMKYMNNLNPHTSHGTMYQLQGIPMRSV